MNWKTGALRALEWAKVNKGRVLAVATVAVGLAARFVPSFPGDEVLGVLRAVLGV